MTYLCTSATDFICTVVLGCYLNFECWAIDGAVKWYDCRVGQLGVLSDDDDECQLFKTKGEQYNDCL